MSKENVDHFVYHHHNFFPSSMCKDESKQIFIGTNKQKLKGSEKVSTINEE